MISRALTTALLAVLAACDISGLSSRNQSAGRSIRVYNLSCATVAGCTPLAIGGWPANWAIPCSPTGCFRAFDTVSLRSACVRFPDSLSFTVRAIDQQGNVVSTTILQWTQRDPIYLQARAAGDAAWANAAIRPDSALGWSLSVRIGDVLRPVPAEPCIS